MKPPENEWLAVFNEVCRDDYYRIRNLPFTPDVVLDLGANVGAFTSLARMLFPLARIIAVEPHPRTVEILKRSTSHFPGIFYIEKAIGTGNYVLRGEHALEPPYFGALCSYVTSDQMGFRPSQVKEPPGQDGRDGLPPYFPSNVPVVHLDELLEVFTEPEDKVLLKMDCEGGENAIFDDEPSMIALRRVDYITMEMHFYSKGTGTENQAVAKRITESLMSLKDTHNCELDDSDRRFTALKKDRAHYGSFAD